MQWVILVLAVVGVSLVIWQAVNYSRLRKYQQDSLIVFGKKGHGKSLLFSVMARQCRKKGYLSNTDFHFRNQILVKPSSISLSPNDWESVMLGQVVKVDRVEAWEGKPVFLDDAGIYFPNFADSLLKKNYPSFPISLAVWRHLYNAPIHVNSQDVGRTWKMIREQADGFIKARRFFKVGPVGFLTCSYYERFNSAEEDLSPIKKVFLNKFSSSEVSSYKALHGIIKDFTLVVWLPHHKYDSRYFRKVFFGPDIGQDSDSALPACTSAKPVPPSLPIDMPSKSQAPSAKPEQNSIKSARSDERSEGSKGSSGNPFPSSFCRERDKGEGSE